MSFAATTVCNATRDEYNGDSITSVTTVTSKNS